MTFVYFSAALTHIHCFSDSGGENVINDMEDDILGDSLYGVRKLVPLILSNPDDEEEENLPEPPLPAKSKLGHLKEPKELTEHELENRDTLRSRPPADAEDPELFDSSDLACEKEQEDNEKAFEKFNDNRRSKSKNKAPIAYSARAYADSAAAAKRKQVPIDIEYPDTQSSRSSSKRTRR